MEDLQHFPVVLQVSQQTSLFGEWYLGGVSGFLIWGLVWVHLYPKYYFNHSLYLISILFLRYALRKDFAKDRNALSPGKRFFAMYMEGSVLLGLACEIHGTTCIKYLRL